MDKNTTHNYYYLVTTLFQIQSQLEEKKTDLTSPENLAVATSKVWRDRQSLVLRGTQQLFSVNYLLGEANIA